VCGLVLQALGLEVRSVLAIGGIGGLAIGLAGREICENLLNGFLLMTTVSNLANHLNWHVLELPVAPEHRQPGACSTGKLFDAVLKSVLFQVGKLAGYTVHTLSV
jgi:hypothetical protein